MPHSDNSTHLPRRPLLLLMGGLLISIGMRVFLPTHFIEEAYSRRLFCLIRPAVDYTVGWLPIPLFYLFWLGVVYLLFGLVRGWIMGRRRGATRWRTTKLTGLRVLTILTLLITVFLWVWGFNYGRQPVEQRMGFAVYQPTLEELRSTVYTEAHQLGQLRATISKDTLALTDAVLPQDLEAAVRPLLAATLRAHDYPTPGRPRAWQLLPRGILLRLGTAGVYWPWATQGNIDAGLHPLQKPAVLAHELSHAYGFGDEGTCSFWAQLTADQTDDPGLVYTLRLAYWRQLAGRLRYADPDNYLAWRAAELDAGIRNDLQAIYDNGALYQDIAPALRDATYTAYLHAQGIQEGLLNYGRVVQLVEGYRRNYSPR